VPKITGSDGHVNINSYNRKVLLTGEVKDGGMKEAVEREVRAIDGVISVVNELEIAPPTSYTARSNDVIITGRVKSGLIEMKTISATSFKVVTERGVVYLMGRVTPREANIAADVARTVSGVQKVVKIFEYLTEDELKTLAPAAGSSTVNL
jgi:osmotically-inducible protein OsmY